MASSGQERFWQAMRAWFARMDVMAPYAPPDNDPDALLARAQEEMREMHARNRERAVYTITQKNNLQQMVDDTQKRVDLLQQKAAQAERDGDSRRAEQLREEAAAFGTTLEQIRDSLTQAIETSEAVKEVIRGEEQRIRRKTSQAMALRTQWKALQLQQELVRVARAAREETGGSALPRERGEALLSQAVRQRDELAELTERTWREVESLREKVTLARDQGSEGSERALLREMEQAEAALVTMREALAQAVEVTSRAGEYLAGGLPASVAYLEAVGEAGEEPIWAVTPEDPASYGFLIGAALLLAALALAALWWLLL